MNALWFTLIVYSISTQAGISFIPKRVFNAGII